MLRPLALIASFLAVAAPAPLAAQAIGDATTVVRDVKGVLSGRVIPVTAGDTVYRDQIVRTMADSSAVLTFLDKTGMAIGPLSEVRLDDFVFSGKSGPRTVDAVKGLFRFISGPGEVGHDYKVRTPHATIAVRGTTFDVRVTDTQTTVVLHEGAIDVCNGGSCRSVKPGETVDAARGEVQVPRLRLPADWTFTATARKEQRAALEKAETALKTSSAASHETYERREAAKRASLAAAKDAAPRPNARPDAKAPPVPAAPVGPVPAQVAAAPQQDVTAADGAARKAIQPSSPLQQTIGATTPPPGPLQPGPTLTGAATGETAPAMPKPESAAATAPQPASTPGSTIAAAQVTASHAFAAAPPPARSETLPPLARSAMSGVQSSWARAEAGVEGTSVVPKPAPAPPRPDVFAMPAGTLLSDARDGQERVVLAAGPSRPLLGPSSRTHDPAIIVMPPPPPEVYGVATFAWILPIPDARARAGPPLRPG